MKKREESRRAFMGTVGATALGGLCGLSVFGCEPRDGIGQSSPRPKAPETRDLLEAAEGIFRPTSSGATIHWVPRTEVVSQVLTGPSQVSLTVVHETTSRDPVEFEITGYGPSSEFYWQCRHRRANSDDWLVSDIRRHRTKRNPGEQFRVAIIADSHYGSARHQAKRRENITQCRLAAQDEPADFGIWLGDEACALFGGDSEKDARTEPVVRESWRTWRQFMQPLLAQLPTFLVLGNHEGEAGFYQQFNRERDVHLQRWATIARKQYFPNPLPTTYREGGENEGLRGILDIGMAGGANDGNCSPLQNYFAWTWGDALFVVLDVFRYTDRRWGVAERPEDWTLGAVQLKWLERVLSESRARWKFVVSHHLVGGSPWDGQCKEKNAGRAYGRGGARYARIGEQAIITDIMKRVGSQFFLYGHDHVFAHQEAEGIHFVCCGRPTSVPFWASSPGFVEAYGDHRARDPHDFIMDVGYTRLTVGPDKVVFEYVKTGNDPKGGENITANVGDVVHRFEVT